MSNYTKDLNSYQYSSSYNHYNISGSSTYNANMQLSSQGAYELGFELSQVPSSEFFNSPIGRDNGLYDAYNYSTTTHKTHEVVGGGGASIESETRVSASPSSSEADHHPGGQDSGKILRKIEAGDGGREDDHPSQKLVKTKKKEEKKQKEPRVSFMTKTDVDHLQDGYRWRKYGQKAVKNSPYPRSYYRCTTQKCNVKKRVERSYQDPTVVITTYESQHNHPLPTNRRTSMFTGSAASDYNSSSSQNFSDIIINNTPRSFSHDNLFRASYANYVNVNPNYHQQQQHPQEESEYELLKEMFPLVFFKQEP